MLYNVKTRTVQLNNFAEREEIQNFLKSQSLSFDNDVEYTVALVQEGTIIATGSLNGKVLKCIAVNPNYKGLGLSNRIVSLLINEAYQRGITHLFIYTRPENYRMFSDMGFYKISEVSNTVVLLENNPYGIKKYIDDIKIHRQEGKIISSIVMNCNPFTLGHQYLIEKASKVSDVLHIFIVWEDKSTFPSEVRYNLVKEGTKHLSNVIIHKGKDYIISNATFPSYFMKEKNNIVEKHALLDLKIFGEYIVPALNINTRFVGEEPYCAVTRTYNEVMKKTLPNYDVEVLEIPRFKLKDKSISASRVRNFLKNDMFSAIKEIVPKTTYDYLISKDAEVIIKNIKKQDTRH